MTSEKEPDSDWAKLYKYPARSDTIVPALQFGAFSGRIAFLITHSLEELLFLAVIDTRTQHC